MGRVPFTAIVGLMKPMGLESGSGRAHPAWWELMELAACSQYSEPGCIPLDFHK